MKQFAIYKAKASVEKILSVEKKLHIIDENLRVERTTSPEQVWATAPDYWPYGDSRFAAAEKIMARHFGGRPRGKQSIITALNAGADPVDFGFDCRADDGQGNEYWCKNQGATIVRLNCYTDPETDKKYWDDNVSGWENHQ
jgi:hypothetical protein